MTGKQADSRVSRGIRRSLNRRILRSTTLNILVLVVICCVIMALSMQALANSILLDSLQPMARQSAKAENPSGFIKSWDNACMQTMLHANGTYPNEYTRYYAGQLLEGQGEGSIDAISGASSSHGTFQVLARAVPEQARRGDFSIVFVDTAH